MVCFGETGSISIDTNSENTIIIGDMFDTQPLETSKVLVDTTKDRRWFKTILQLALWRGIMVAEKMERLPSTQLSTLDCPLTTPGLSIQLDSNQF